MGDVHHRGSLSVTPLCQVVQMRHSQNHSVKFVFLVRNPDTFQFSSVQSFSRVRLFETHELQHARSCCPSPTPGVHPNSCPSCRWCHPAISSSVVPFSSYPQTLPTSESLPMSQLFTWGGQSTGVSALTSLLPKNPGLISFRMDWLDLLAVQGTLKSLLQHHSSKVQFFGTQLSSQSNSQIHTWPLEKP